MKGYLNWKSYNRGTEFQNEALNRLSGAVSRLSQLKSFVLSELN